MEPKSRTLNNNEDTITREDLRMILSQIKDFRPDVHVRFRLLGKTWQRNFCRVFVVSEAGIVLIDPIENKVEIVSNLGEITEFEIDSRFQHFSSYSQYQVVDATQ